MSEELTWVGDEQWMYVSNLPGLNNAPSRRSGLEVAAITVTPLIEPSTPSNWVSNWLTTRSVTPVESWPRLYKLIVKNKLTLFYLFTIK